MIHACIFDLDGVVVDTAKYHYLAWKRLAAELGFDFEEYHNERLKGVSRMTSLEILLEVGGMTNSYSPNERERMATKKNEWYLEYIRKMTPDEILPGAKGFIEDLKLNGIGVALGSASKNAPLILERINMLSHFDVIVDGNRVSKAKPDPEIFLLGASDMGVSPKNCIVFEDAEAGVEAALNAGMRCVGIGSSENLSKANVVVPNLVGFSFVYLENTFAKI